MFDQAQMSVVEWLFVAPFSLLLLAYSQARLSCESKEDIKFDKMKRASEKDGKAKENIKNEKNWPRSWWCVRLLIVLVFSFQFLSIQILKSRKSVHWQCLQSSWNCWNSKERQSTTFGIKCKQIWKCLIISVQF